MECLNREIHLFFTIYLEGVVFHTRWHYSLTLLDLKATQCRSGVEIFIATDRVTALSQEMTLK